MDTPLSRIAEILEEDLDPFATYLSPADGLRKPEMLYVVLEDEESDVQFVLEVLEIDGIQRGVTGVPLIDGGQDYFQFIVRFSQPVPEATQIDVIRFLTTINLQLPIGNFGLSMPAGILYFRFMLMTEDDEPSETMVLEVVNMIRYFCLVFYPLIAAVGADDITVEAGWEKLGELGMPKLDLEEGPARLFAEEAASDAASQSKG